MFERTLREWRTRRGMSQMALALAADVSPRHLSLLESARARPSASMVMRLCEALDLPLRERNGLLVAAGFAPQFGDSDWLSPQMAEVRHAAQLLLAAPTFLIMTGLGALLPAGAEALRRPLSDAARRKLGIAVLAATAVLSGRLLLEAGAMRLYEQGGETRVLAAKVDPGNYRIRALLAQSAARRGRCGEARTWAAAASARMPDADFPRIVVRRCR